MQLTGLSGHHLNCIVIVFAFFAPTFVISEERRKCEDIAVPMCRGLAYNKTSMPNQFSHEKQEEAGLEVHQFWPLVEMKCSPDLQFFLCSIYTPICMEDYEESLPPCQSVCERAKYGCLKVMLDHNFDWPPHLDCQNFPSFGNPITLCMDNRNGELPASTKASPTEDGRQKNCTQPCPNLVFTQKEKSFARQVIFSVAVASFVCSFLVLFTFFSNSGQFKYPERAAISLSACQLMVSLGYFIRIFINPNHSSTSHSGYCTLVFVLLYYFGMSASLWWIILTFTWFLSAKFQWGSEPLSNYSLYFHLIAWLLPGIKSFIIVASGYVDSEPLIDICYVGIQNSEALMNFVIAPLCIYVTIGSSFLLAGFISIAQLRNVIRRHLRCKGDQHKLKKLMVRILLFSLLYIVQTSVLIYCNLYEFLNHSQPELNHDCSCSPQTDVPFLLIYLLKHCMSLGIGIAVLCWIFSAETFLSWNRCIQAMCCCSPKVENL